jgi:hypothetical protein
VEKVAQVCFELLRNFQKSAEVLHRPMGEISPNLVTLLSTRTLQWSAFTGKQKQKQSSMFELKENFDKSKPVQSLKPRSKINGSKKFCLLLINPLATKKVEGQKVRIYLVRPKNLTQVQPL